MADDDLKIKLRDRVEVLEGPYFGVTGTVIAFTKGGLVIISRDSDDRTIRVNPCHMARRID